MAGSVDRGWTRKFAPVGPYAPAIRRRQPLSFSFKIRGCLRAISILSPRQSTTRLKDRGFFPSSARLIGVTSERLKENYAAFQPRLDRLPSPRVAALIGGRSKAFDLSPRRAEVLADDLCMALDETAGALMMTFSRRTPSAARAILGKRLSNYPGIIWNGEGGQSLFCVPGCGRLHRRHPRLGEYGRGGRLYWDAALYRRGRRRPLEKTPVSCRSRFFGDRSPLQGLFDPLPV